MRLAALLATLIGFQLAAAPAPGAEPGLPQELPTLIDAGHELPRYAEAFYHPLGRSPVLDAVLGDPFSLPVYARQVSSALRAAAATGRTARLLVAALRAGAVPLDPLPPPPAPAGPIPGLAEAIGPAAAAVIERAWALFAAGRAEAEAALAPLAEADRKWLLERPDAFFFGLEGGDEYQFFTCERTVQLKVFRLAAGLDLARLARAGRLLAAAADELEAHAAVLARIPAGYVAEVGGLSLVIGGPGDDVHTAAADFALDPGGDDLWQGNAGGTAGTRPAALAVDLAGDDRYEGGLGSQGAGLLGAGGLVDLAGDDCYAATRFAQGSGWFGCGFLADRAGDDEYHGGYFVQAAAGFGFGLLDDRLGDDRYRADGMAQAAATTLGAAVLADGAGDDDYRCGGPGETDWPRSIGIGQGGATGLRDYPWKDRPAFYGGVAFLDDAGGDDRFVCPLFAQGGGYCFGVGVLAASGGDDRFFGRSDTQGATIHLAAGLLLKEDGDDFYDGGWGSTAVGGDRSAGILIDTGGDDRYRGQAHNVGTARKPKALGLLVDLAGDDRYEFSGESGGRVMRPSDPEEWAWALLADLGGRDEYPDTGGDLARGDGLSWEFEGHGFGVDCARAVRDPARRLWAALPERPRVPFPFDPLTGWSENVAWRPLAGPEWSFPPDPPPPSAPDSDSVPARSPPADSGSPAAAPAPSPPAAPPPAWSPAPLPIGAWIEEARRAGYDRRRQLYEMLDLARFTGAAPADPDRLASLLAHPAGAPEDLLAYAGLWATVDKSRAAFEQVAAPLERGEIESAYARRMLIRLAGEAGGGDAEPVLAACLARDPDELCRRSAAGYLARLGTPAALAALGRAAGDRSPAVRVSLAAGLRDSTAAGALGLVQPLVDDENLFVRRAAATTAISLGDKAAVGRLLESMRVQTLDTGENYGFNLFATLADYLGPEPTKELGLDLEKWLAWWRSNEREFDLAAALAARAERQAGQE